MKYLDMPEGMDLPEVYLEFVRNVQAGRDVAVIPTEEGAYIFSGVFDKTENPDLSLWLATKLAIMAREAAVEEGETPLV